MTSPKQQHSASLLIEQGNAVPIDFTQNSFQVHSEPSQNLFLPDKIDDTFELSLDEHSLSFQIQELKEQSTCHNVIKEGHLNSQQNMISTEPPTDLKVQSKPIPVIQEERKRKRKEIFQKYKQKNTESLLANSSLQPNTNDLISTIDQIFEIKSPEKSQFPIQRQQPFLTQKTSSQAQSKIQITAFRKKQSAVFEMGRASFEEIDTVGPASKKVSNLPLDAPLVEKTQNHQNLFSVTQFQIPSNVTDLQRVESTSKVIIGSTHSFLIQSELSKLSMIQLQEEQVSRESGDIETFLNSEIFRDDNLERTILKDDMTYKNIEVSMVNPSIMIHTNLNLESPINALYTDNRLGLAREKSQAVLPKVQEEKLLKKSISQRKIKVFETVNLQQKVIVQEKVLSYEQSRIPVYLREIRRKNTVVPNFYLKPKTKDFYSKQNEAFKELLSEFKKAVDFLHLINELSYERFTLLNEFEKKLLNSLTLQTFMNCGWEKVQPINQINLLQPRQNFNKRKYEYEKVKGALSNYLYITQYYQKIDLNLQDPKAQKKYLQIRAKFWQIEKNIKMIGEDIYLLAVQQVFPSHYMDFFKALKGDLPRFSKPFQQLQYARNLLARYYALRNGGDLLCLSEVGTQLRMKLQKMIQKALMI